ncbi:hypothetical protein [Kribbella sp. NPDC004875]|uniref:hypothetical protein n=1 Tax=Kribbella sp. NPDC004875 TaxID=3364107 RepID=UPI0036B53555
MLVGEGKDEAGDRAVQGEGSESTVICRIRAVASWISRAMASESNERRDHQAPYARW